MAHFERRTWEENTWKPEIAGVDFSLRVAKFMGEVSMNGTNVYTAWFVDDDYEAQITPDTTRVFLSLVDDDSDTINVLDRRDNLWFTFIRAQHPETFPTVLQLVVPWATTASSLTPMEDVYQRFINASIRDTAGDELFIPDDFLEE
jgi:hypothetical protein